MLESVIIGAGFAFAAAIQPGPLQAFLLSSVARRGWKPTLPAALAPLVSDGPIAVLVLLVLHNVPAGMTRVLQGAGGVLLFWFAWGSYQQWKQHPPEAASDGRPAPGTLLQAASVNILNPNPYLGWSLVLGPAAIKAWHQSPAHAVALLIAFYGTMIAGLAGTILFFGATRFLGARLHRGLILVSALVLAGLGVYQVLGSLVRS